MGKILTLIIASVFLTMAAGCNSSGCTDNQNSLPLASFYSSTDGDRIAVKGIDIGGIGAPDDSLLYTSDTQLENIYLPLRSTATVTSYCFHYTQEGIDSERYNDTITFRYSSSPYFASEECGAMLRYDIKSLTYTRHIIDSIAIVDSLITNADIERIKIYLRTSE